MKSTLLSSGVLASLVPLVSAFSVPSLVLLQQSNQRSHSKAAPAAATYQNAQAFSRLQVSSLDTTDSTSVEPEMETDDDFDWFKAWYPLVPVEFLDKEKPHAFKLLGMDIVVWNDGPVDKGALFGSRKDRVKGAKKADGNWRVFVDQCPHRKVPLSEGRIEDDGSLLCSYHGWRFNGKGETIDIPQLAKDSNELEKIRANPKSNCNSFPVKIVNGVLYVWPDAGDDARIESILTDVPQLALGDDVDKERVWEGTWNFRELPYGHDFFIENVVDPAHVPVSHHNVVGSRYDDQTMSLKSIVPLTKNGFGVQKYSPKNGDEGSTTFNAPAQVLIKADFSEDDDGPCQYLELYSSPSRPGFTNHVGRMVIIKGKDNKMPNLLRQFTLPMPKWVNHVLSSAFLNQDALFLHGQERSLANYGQYRTSMPGADDSYSKAVLPISADKGVMKFRTWMSKFGGGHIPFKGVTTMPAANNEVVFDVWNAHTKHCTHCLAALKNLKKMRFAAFFFSALLATVRPKKLGVVGSTLGALMFSGVGGVLSKLIGLFYRYEFSHADNH